MRQNGRPQDKGPSRGRERGIICTKTEGPRTKGLAGGGGDEQNMLNYKVLKEEGQDLRKNTMSQDKGLNQGAWKGRMCAKP
jgi:hypothetical protein